MIRSAEAMPCLIAVAGPIGGGKTALVKGLAAGLNGAPTLHFDDYELASRKSPVELERWLAAGADFNELRAPGLLAALQALKRGESAIDPAHGAAIGPGDTIVFEMPLGREHGETAPLIDIVIWVDIPLDVALARKVGEYAAAAAADQSEDPRGFLRWLDRYLDLYTTQVRQVLQLQKRRVAASADIVLDGMQSQDALIADALSAVAEFRARRDRR
jgi:uridine kinase